MAFLKLSPTKAATWVDCPRKFFFSYVAKRRTGRSWAHLSFANAVHGALRDWFDLPVASRNNDSVIGLVSRNWSDAGFMDAQQASRWRDSAVQMVRDYVHGIEPDFEPVSTERTLAFKDDAFVVEGRIDRIDARIDSLAVVDYKTGSSIPQVQDVRGSQALAMYALMVQRALGEPCFDVSLHHVPSGTKVSWVHSPESLARQRERLAVIATDITRAQDTWESADGDDDLRDELFPARPGGLCGFCDYWDLCGPGQEVSTRRQAWDGLATREMALED